MHNLKKGQVWVTIKIPTFHSHLTYIKGKANIAKGRSENAKDEKADQSCPRERADALINPDVAGLIFSDCAGFPWLGENVL